MEQEDIYEPATGNCLRQGEIISGLVQVKISLESINNQGGYDATDIEHPLAIIVTQDCDLEQDYKVRYEGGKERKLLPNILLCEIEFANTMVHGTRNESVFSSTTIQTNFKQNDDFRFHFLQEVRKDQDALQQGIDESGVEFKRHFTIPTDELYFRVTRGHARRRCKLRSPYLEHFSTRYHYYHYRVALPNDHAST